MIPMHSELLAGLDDATATGLRSVGTYLHVAPGDLLFKLGDEANELYLIERGRLALTLPMRVASLEEQVLIEERQAGQVVAWSALIPPHRLTLTAKALVDTEVLSLPRPALLAYFVAHPDAGSTVMRNVAFVVGQRLQVFQAMWLREMQRVIRLSYA
jgi:CRP/FNR family transcriptional regulator, cyclic AMP receptor protein